MIIEEDIKLDFCDVLLKPQRSSLHSRKDVTVTREFEDFACVPIIAANMDTVGSMEMAEALEQDNCMTALHKHYDPQQLCDFFKDGKHKNVFYSLGTSASEEVKLMQIVYTIGIDNITKICIDVANGYTESFLASVKRVRDLLPNAFIMAGNVVTPDMTFELIQAGVNCVKIGIGSGSVCKTRSVTGTGYPQLTALIKCARVAHQLGGYICADGGCVVSGDIVKAFGAGADFVMIGGMLSGTDESNGELTTVDGIQYKEYYGMSSEHAMDKHHNGMANYRASEGKTVKVKYVGKVCDIVSDILGGIRSAMTYIGAKKLKDIPKRTTFIRVNRQLNNIFGDSE